MSESGRQVAVPDAAARSESGVAGIARSIQYHLQSSLGRLPEAATPYDWYRAVSLAVRDHLQLHWAATTLTYLRSPNKVAAYLSAEYLLGPHLGNNLASLGLETATREALRQLGRDLDALLAVEEEPGLGNGGLGRLAACFLDSAASLERPLVGYGIRYEFGIFDQEIRDGWQVEVTDLWLRHGNPWEIAKPEVNYLVNWGGRTEHHRDADGRDRARWVPYRVVKGMAYDTPIQGYRVNTCNTLRLWSAEAVESFDFQAFNTGDYYSAVGEKVLSETVSKVLYPNDEPEVGKRLRLAQQYFFVSCSLQDMFQLLRLAGEPAGRFAERFAVQLNDTHPSIAVAELMRLLLDEHGFEWDAAWDVVVRSFGYTNHTLLPEALETWPLALFAESLPRHLEIILEINSRFLEEVRARFPGDEARVARMSLIGEDGGRSVRMAHLATVGSHAVNGVAALHTELLENSVLRDFHELWPGRFSNKTNGVTPRRFVALANPGLRDLITEAIGERWLVDLEELRGLERFVDDAGFRERWRAVKLANKRRLAAWVSEQAGVQLEPEWLFDVQVKRIHEYKRQHLNALHVLSMYRRLKQEPGFAPPPRVFVFGGKAAPGYFMAKRIIRLVGALAETINGDPTVNRYLRVAYVPNFNVQNAQLIYPAADLSEQISTAGKEASGTGNMKFMMNGALTIGTLDGANVEIRAEVGDENFFLFGLSAAEVEQVHRSGYRSMHHVEQDPELRATLELLAAGGVSRGDRELFKPLVDNLLQSDPFLVLADYAAYRDCQRRVDAAWLDGEAWTRKSILNTARSGKFSSDRAIREYCEGIWGVRPAPVTLR